MPTRDEINVTAAALKRSSNSPSFHFGVDQLRHACSSEYVTYVETIKHRATGLLFATDDPEQQAGIVALAASMSCNVDVMVATAISARSLFAQGPMVMQIKEGETE